MKNESNKKCYVIVLKEGHSIVYFENEIYGCPVWISSKSSALHMDSMEAVKHIIKSIKFSNDEYGENIYIEECSSE